MLRSPELRSPALRRAFFLAAGALLAVSAPAAGAPFRPAPNFAGGSRPDPAEGMRVLEEFRRAGIAGTYWLAFELRVLPRRGQERVVRGEILGTRADTGPVTRLTIPTGTGIERWLIRSGPDAAAWHWAGNATRELAAADLFTPVAATEFTVFDLQMPFLYWNDFAYEGLARVRGRPAHRLLLYPPADFAAARPELTGVRVYLDTQFQALVQADLLGPKGEAAKTLTVLDLKKSADQWIVKSIDLRNHATRDKTRFTVEGAAFGLELRPSLFTPEQLGTDAPPVPAAKVERF